MNEFAKTIIVIGALLILVGLITVSLSRIPGLGKLPGDIFIKKQNFSFYFPFTTCLIVSLVLSLLLYLWNRK